MRVGFEGIRNWRRRILFWGLVDYLVFMFFGMCENVMGVVSNFVRSIGLVGWVWI